MVRDGNSLAYGGDVWGRVWVCVGVVVPAYIRGPWSLMRSSLVTGRGILVSGV